MRITHKQVKAIKKFLKFNFNDYYLKGTSLSQKKFKSQELWDYKLYSLTIKEASEIISKCIERLKFSQEQHDNSITEDKGLENDDRNIFGIFDRTEEDVMNLHFNNTDYKTI